MSSDVKPSVSIKRAYEPPAEDDGVRVLVDRLWPRGISKERLAVSYWMKEVAPSAALRKWFAHDPGRFQEFTKRYVTELQSNPQFEELKKLAHQEHHLTLVYAAKDEQHNQAVILKKLLEG